MEDVIMKKTKIKFRTLTLAGILAIGLSGFIQFRAQGQEFGSIGELVGKIENTGHQVQVWEVLPEFTKTGKYKLSIKHAVVGAKGSFYLIAWADTNHDGIPDKEIGRSQLLSAQEDGDWSSWEFYADYKKIYVGNTWSQSDEQVYYQMGGKLEGYNGLNCNVFYSVQFNGVPNASTGPRFTNIKLSFLNENSNILGVTDAEVTKIENTEHQVQVWQVLPEFSKAGKYNLSIKHAVAGAKGSFYLIAWADTNHDGKPDKEIGRSQLMTAQKAGEWSSWEFYSTFEKIFVGNTWSQNDEQVYYQVGTQLKAYKGLSNQVFYSRQFNGVPNSSTGPRFTNIKLIPE